ncbi:MAG: YbfB/YjiJ family MFS transporter [Pseudomonadota bacterium]|nr:YbfB/YjiJ family MFS transporter [Pseudomonadota bacterium]
MCSSPVRSYLSDDGVSAWRMVLAGAVALAVAMGIGRFAFTPLWPLMLRDGTLDAARGAEWAAANYIGYLLGALTAARWGQRPWQGLRWALGGVAACTVLAGSLPAAALTLAGSALRLAAGVFSAWALVCASAWCMGELARRQAVGMAAWMYTGVGAGIALTGLLAWLGGMQPARALWLELGALAAAGAAFSLAQRPAAQVARPSLAPPAPPAPPAPAAPAEPKGVGQQARLGSPHGALVLCYGAFGFGYIVPATFLPAMAREQVAHPLVFGLTWPLFGAAAALSVALAARALGGWPRRRVWALAQGVMALGTAVLLLSQALWALALSAVLVGGTFMVATMAGLQLARELAPEHATRLLARMTVAFAAGQIAGPLLVRALGSAGLSGPQALWWSHALATAMLAATAAWLAREAPAGHMDKDTET